MLCRRASILDSVRFSLSLTPRQFGLGFFYGRELFLRGLGYEMVAAVEAEVGCEEQVDAHHDQCRDRAHDEGRGDRRQRQYQCHPRGCDTPGVR
jgi:hypothetical protein